MKILHLTLKKKWFDLIASGKKTEEYRDIKPYWTRRLIDRNGYRHFDEVHFRNGYKKDSPFMRVICKEIDSPMTNENIVFGSDLDRYVIKLGKILEIKNHKPIEEICPVCESPLEDNGKCSDVGNNNCMYQV